MQSKEALYKYFGYKKFRKNQEEIIQSILDGNNIVAVLPTGAGKSICYQIPALVSKNFSIVISPLISLMKDQVDSLNKNENVAAFINSSLSYYESEAVLQNIAYGKTKLLYVSPERLEYLNFAERIKNLQPEYLFVDEAHCISEWGHNFRPSYRKIKEFIDYVSIGKVSAFTATATPEVVNDIVNQLNFKKPKLFVRGFERENLHLNVIITKKKKEKCFELISEFKTPAIIYTSSRKKAEEVSEYLNMHRVKCEYYHAGMAPEIRKKIQEDFLNDQLPVIAATNAFGMGIDKKDIRLVLHYNTPGSIENYYQEIGRAGRDGKESFAFLLHDDSDINIQNFFILNAHPDKTIIQQIYNGICDYGKVALGNKSDKEIPLNIEYLSSYANKDISKGLLNASLKFLEEAGYVKLFSEYKQKITLQFNMEKNRLKQFVKNVSNDNLKETILILLREYGSEIFQNKIQFSLSKLSNKLDLPENIVEETLTNLDNLGIINYSKPLSKENLILTSPRVKADRLNLNYKKISDAYLNLQQKLNKMVEYVFTNECRFKYILHYFGENVESYSCGKCDICSSYTPSVSLSANQYIKEIILRTLSQSGKSLHESSLLTILKGSSKTGHYKEFDTYGSCGTYNKEDLKLIIYQMLSEGLIKRKVNGKNNLELANDGFDYLKQQDLLDDLQSEVFGFEENLELFNLLKEIRQKASKKFLQTGYLICNDEILREITSVKPLTRDELLKIQGFNIRMFNKIGNDILETVNQFMKEKEKSPSKSYQDKQLPQNLTETYNLLRKGFKLKDIASLRNLSEAIISMQIETIVEYKPQTDIEKLFDGSLLELISKEIRNGYTELKELKNRLPENATYPLIRIALAKHKFT